MSSKKKRRVASSGPVWHMSAEEATLARMPKYNAHACGTGAHGDAKYNRARQKQAWRKEIDLEGPRNRGVLPFIATDRKGVALSVRDRWGDSLSVSRRRVAVIERVRLSSSSCRC